MPKRVKTHSQHKSKKSKKLLSPTQKRNSIPRSCKNSNSLDFNNGKLDFSCGVNISASSNKLGAQNNSLKMNIGNDKRKTKIKEEARTSQSSDEELDVVFDLQEDKKNKIYEVITVMSDDETPNQITYERIYADNPEDKIVKNDEIMNHIQNSNISENSKSHWPNNEKTNDKLTNINVITKEDGNKSCEINPLESVESDDEIQCLTVIDQITKTNNTKANVEVVCLSSDSETENSLPIPGMGHLKPTNCEWSLQHFLEGYQLQQSSIDKSTSSVGFKDLLASSFCNPHPVNLSKKSFTPNQLTDWESSSSSRYAISEELSTHSNTPLNMSNEDSLSSSPSNDQQNSDKGSSIDDNDSCSESNLEEENKIYWKADRELRWKADLLTEEYTTFGSKVHQGEIDVDRDNSLTFKVMSYNVLGQTLLEQHRYLYKDHDRKVLQWSQRWDLIYEEIKQENPEILCLQEVEESYLTSHYSSLRHLGYKLIYKKRTSTYPDGVAVLYKTDVFTDGEHHKVEYYQPGVSVLDRDNVGLVVRLRPRTSPCHAVVIATTHLLYNPRRSDVKLAQIQMLLAEIDRLAFNSEANMYYPVILSGDFNLRPQNGVYKLLTEAQLVYEATCRKNLHPCKETNILPKVLLPNRLGLTDSCQHIEVVEARAKGKSTTPSSRVYHSESNRSPITEGCREDNRFQSGKLHHKFKFQSVYPHVKEDGQKEATTHHDSWITVDYIFYSSQAGTEHCSKGVGCLQLLSRLRLPTQDECEKYLRRLPNFAVGSDHLPLVAKFLLQFQ